MQLTSDHSRSARLERAYADIFQSFCAWRIWHTLAYQDIKQRYRRSVIGPLWLTLGVGVNVTCIGVIWGNLFGFDAERFIPYLALGLIYWDFMTSVINSSCSVFYGNARFILQIKKPFFVYVIWMIWRQILIFFHNFLVFLVIIFVFDVNLWDTLYLVPFAFVLLVITITPYALILAVVSTRYRDIPPIVSSIINVMFFVSPILWSRDQLGERGVSWIDLNPLTHVLEVVRDPLLGIEPRMISWVVFCGVAVIGWGCAVALLARFRHRISYWI